MLCAPPQVTQLFTGYVGAMLREYSANPATAWKSKDCAVYLVVALTVNNIIYLRFVSNFERSITLYLNSHLQEHNAHIFT